MGQKQGLYCRYRNQRVVCEGSLGKEFVLAWVESGSVTDGDSKKLALFKYVC